MNTEILNNSGFNCDRAIQRCAGNADLYEKILRRFASEGSNYSRVQEALLSADYQTVHDLVHEIKGVSGNLEFTALFDICCKVLAEIKNERYSNVAPLLLTYEEEYKKVIDTINKALTD